ncbi:MAG: ribosome recycling factor [Firmicutes bacterium]|jgi:ribosome recycling factor|nr:ribosome recycling factor [Bacillota bacterium]
MDEIYVEIEERMKKSVSNMKRELLTLRAGRASPALVEGLEVDYYGTMTPLNQLAGITVPEPRLIVIQPWDKGAIKEVEKAILKSDLGLTPNNDGNLIRLAIPQLTEERRLELVKFVRKKGEEGRIAIRNLRREANEKLKAAQKDGQLSEDQFYTSQEKTQEMTDDYIKMIDGLLEEKEKEIMEV